MKKIINIALLNTLVGTSVLLAGSTQITSEGVTPADFKSDKYITIKVIDNEGIPLRDGAIQMNPNPHMTMYAMDLTNINEGKYVVKVRHSEDCKEKKIYHETIILRALRTKDSISNNVVSIPVDFDCRDDTSEFHFETEHPYRNNTNITKVLPPLCSEGSVCTTDIKYAHIIGETEANYDYITISQKGVELGKFSGHIDEKVELDDRAETKIKFQSDYSNIAFGVTVSQYHD